MSQAIFGECKRLKLVSLIWFSFLLLRQTRKHSSIFAHIARNVYLWSIQRSYMYKQKVKSLYLCYPQHTPNKSTRAWGRFRGCLTSFGSGGAVIPNPPFKDGPGAEGVGRRTIIMHGCYRNNFLIPECPESDARKADDLTKTLRYSVPTTHAMPLFGPEGANGHD